MCFLFQLYDLAWKMSRDTHDLLWWGIIGLTEQILLLKVEDEKHLLDAGTVRDHVSRYSASSHFF